MSRDKIDKAMHDQEHYESLKQRGVSDDRAKRVATTPMDPAAKPAKRSTAPLAGKESRTREKIHAEEQQTSGPKVRTTSPRTGI